MCGTGRTFRFSVTRVRTITVGGALLVALVLIVLAALLVDSQAQDREDVRKRFDTAAACRPT